MLDRLYGWYGKFVVRGVIGAIALLLIVAIFVSKGGKDTSEMSVPQMRTVTTQPLQELSTMRSVRIIGTVRSVDEAVIQSEATGRVVRVPVSLGDRVAPGAIIAEIENSGERAALIQAEGAYEAALARAAQSTTNVASANVALTVAKTQGIDAYRAAFVAGENAIRNTIDTLFSDPTGSIPGFRLRSQGTAVALNATRTQIETILDAWSLTVAQNPDPERIEDLLVQAERDLLALAQFAQQVSEVASDSENDTTEIDGVSIATIRTSLVTARTAIDTAYQNVQSKHLAIQNARNALESAEIGGTSMDVSAANAAVKQALGVLRAAESALSKTIVRAPFAGTLNTLSVRVGDVVNANTALARVANNGALEVIAFLSESERDQITEGDTLMLEGGVSGVVTHIAPAIDPLTGKTEVRIGVSTPATIKNGDTISVLLADTTSTNTPTSPLRVPIETLKITANGPVVFTVNSEGVLESHAVTMGVVSGASVAIETDLSPDTLVVADARGLKAGDRVNVASEQ